MSAANLPVPDGRVTGSAPSSGASSRPLDAPAWDAFVTASELGSYLQLSGWAQVKAVNGWRARRLLVDVPGGQIGAQVLVTRPRPLPWGFAYAPRGPVATSWDAAAIALFTGAVRSQLPRTMGRISHLRIDPEVELGGPLDRDGAVRAALRAAGWRPSPAIQPPMSRVIDLRPDEPALWGDLRKKWRQYVNKARSAGVVVVEAGAERLDEFYAIYRDTARRAGFPIRTQAAYRSIWDAFAPTGNARLLFAQAPDGTGLATLFLVSCGPRVVEPYGGMTVAGANSRANYLLKWEAIRSSRELGAISYDMWGVVTAGIGQFKAGFGGREIQYIGAWDLVLDPLGRSVYGAAQKGRVFISRRQRALDRSRGAGPDMAAGADE
jgi:lipid II:glycine glycyltransferase (peptidoglycan interpeptide bridge formation enzyme)